jgi:hypothetical protein
MKTFEAIHKVYELLNKGKEKKAWQIISKWESSEHLTSREQFVYKIFKGYLLWLTGYHQKSLALAEELYQKSKDQNDIMNSLDSLLLLCINLFISGRFIKVEKNLKICEDMLKSWEKVEVFILIIHLLKGGMIKIYSADLCQRLIHLVLNFSLNQLIGLKSMRI